MHFFEFFEKKWFSKMCQSRCSRVREMTIFGFHPIVHFLWQLLNGQSHWHWPLGTLKISQNHFGDFQWNKIWPIQNPICPLKLNFANFMQCQGGEAVPGGYQASRVAKLPFTMLKWLIFSCISKAQFDQIEWNLANSVPDRFSKVNYCHVYAMSSSVSSAGWLTLLDIA